MTPPRPHPPGRNGQDTPNKTPDGLIDVRLTAIRDAARDTKIL